MHANKPSFALYERALSALPHSPTFHRSLTDPALLGRMNSAAAGLGYRVV